MKAANTENIYVSYTLKISSSSEAPVISSAESLNFGNLYLNVDSLHPT